ncbi:MAG: hypothetical protein S4CHLAM45_11240 [Chlamydiales bacterium]|nr:hypothetical protein [Chlamydiales bacterium]MCH9619616.1 hypothetical protein [Chlamydiales bacterium]MCH9623222.1 hypothetical protein [Chlamydiales bacterium]
MDKAKLNTILENLSEESLDSTANELLAEMNQGKSLQEAAHITPEFQEEIYVIAHDYYNQGKYNEGIALFQMLTYINPESFRFMYGLASSYHQSKDYLHAILGFHTALSLEPLNPLPAYYMSDCFTHLNANEDAIRYLDLSIAICDEEKKNKEFLKIKERCKLLKASLMKQMKK